MILAESVIEDWKQHVLEQYPNEACAFIVDGILEKVENIAEEPTSNFKVDPIARIRLERKGKVQGFLHSHPYGLKSEDFSQYPMEWASEADMKGWINDNIPWGISSTEGENVSPINWYDDNDIPPLEGRVFISGKYDCYSVVRDYYRLELGITLKNYPREMDWWDKGRDHYLNRYEDAGFVEVPLDEAKKGDLLLMKIGNNVVTHAAVVTDTNVMLHHPVNRLSGYATISKWVRQIAKVIRYAGNT